MQLYRKGLILMLVKCFSVTDKLLSLEHDCRWQAVLFLVSIVHASILLGKMFFSDR